MTRTNKVVWVVGVSDDIRVICLTKEIAERELFKIRDELIREWNKMSNWRGINNNMYNTMIENLSNNDYENWDNYPHECPYLYKTEIMEK